MMKRAKSIEARQQKAIEQKSGLLKNRERVEELKLLPLQYRSDTLVTFLDAAICYGGKSGQLSGVLFSPSRRTGGIGWK